MGSSEKFCLKWNDFEKNISGAFREIREDKDFFDVTLACDDDQLQAHKVILSACSPFFRTILRRNKHDHPLLYLKGVKYADLVSVLNFMYHGEVNVAQEELNSFLAVAEDLKVKGLTQNNGASDDTQSQKSFEPQKSKPLIRNKIDNPIDSKIPSIKPRPAPPPLPRRSPTSYQQDDDIQEVVPVKTEPDSHPVEQPVPTFHPEPHVQNSFPAHHGVVADPNMEYGEDYGDYEGYDGADGGYDGGVLDHSGMQVGLQDGNKGVAYAESELDNLIETMLTKVDVGGVKVWSCTVCSKQHKNKTNIKVHVESTHIEGFTHSCKICNSTHSSRAGLNFHMSTKHRRDKASVPKYI